VQAVAAGGIGLIVVFDALLGRRVPDRRERLGAVLASGGLLLLALTLPARAHPLTSVSGPRLLALGLLVALVAAGCLRSGRAALGGLAAGLLYGYGDVASKALLVTLPVPVRAWSIVTSPYTYATAAAHGTAFLSLQRSFQRGGAVASLAPMTAAMSLLPMAAGVALLGDPLPLAPLPLAARLAGLLACAGGAALLGAVHGSAGASAPAGPPPQRVEVLA